MYLRELKNYKPPPAAKTADASEHVQKFILPKPPPTPESISLAEDLKTYEAQVVEVEGGLTEGEDDVDPLDQYFESVDKSLEGADEMDDVPKHKGWI